MLYSRPVDPLRHFLWIPSGTFSPCSLPEETYVTVDADSVQVLLSFALAHGSASSMLDCLQILLDNLTLELPLASLLHTMEDVQQQKLKQHGEALAHLRHL